MTWIVEVLLIGFCFILVDRLFRKAVDLYRARKCNCGCDTPNRRLWDKVV